MSSQTIASCVVAAALSVSAITDVQAGKKKKLSLVEWTDTVAGNTLIGPKEAWFVYFKDDGTKIVNVDGEVTKLEWRRNDAGVLCEVLLKSRKEGCHDAMGVVVTEKNGVYKFRNRRGHRLKLTVEPGNSRDLK